MDNKDLKKKIEDALEQVRPGLNADGGDVEFIGVSNNVVKLRLTGACGSCPMSTYTLKQGIEATLKKLVPEIKSVEAV
jgi:Fe-S cluster biogenesis protein NfuA